MNFMEFLGFYLIFQVFYPIYFIKNKTKSGYLIARNPGADVAHTEHMAEPRKATWTPTWRDVTGQADDGPTD